MVLRLLDTYASKIAIAVEVGVGGLLKKQQSYGQKYPQNGISPCQGSYTPYQGT